MATPEVAPAAAKTPRSASSTASSTKKDVSIGRRMLVSFFMTIFGLLFFYIVMVFLSTITKGITLERAEPNGWARSASRHTATVTVAPFTLFLLSPPARVHSLSFAVLTACAQFAHFLILSSDLDVYTDRKIHERVFRTDAALHPVFARLPLYTAVVAGTIGFCALLVITTERCFGSALRTRRPALPFSSYAASLWVAGVFTLWFSDHLVAAVARNAEPRELAYPIFFLSCIALGIAVATRRRGTYAASLRAATGAVAAKKDQ